MCLSHGTECIDHARWPIRESQEWTCFHLHNTAGYKSRGTHPAAHLFDMASEEQTLALRLTQCGLCFLLTHPGRDYWLVKLFKVSNWTSEHKPSLQYPYTVTISHLYTCWTVFQQNVSILHCLTSPTSICFLNGCTLYFWEKEPFFCLHLNSLQHKMNDYNISFSLPLLSNTESTLNLRSLHAKKPTTIKLIWNLCLWGCNFTEEKNLVQWY